MLSTLLLAATTGLVSTLHCWGMCGGIVAALSLGAPAALRKRPAAVTALAFAYNLGRIVSYALLGALAGLAAGPAVTGGGVPAFRLLQFAGLVALLLAALRLGGWLPRNGAIERLGLRLWQRLAPLTRRLLPVDRASRALAAGLAWGFLPCGLVYAMLPVGAASGSAGGGALIMLAFGAGTLPGMIAASALAQRLGGLMPGTGLRRYAAAMLIALALAWFGLQWLGGNGAHDHGGHHHHAGADREGTATQAGGRRLQSSARLAVGSSSSIRIAVPGASRSSNWPLSTAHRNAHAISPTSTSETGIRSQTISIRTLRARVGGAEAARH